MLKLHCNHKGVKFLNFAHCYTPLLFYSSISKNGDSPFANYLVEKLGFPKELADSTSTKLIQRRQNSGVKKVSTFYFAANADSVVEFLKKNGLNDTQIQIAVSIAPHILNSKVDKTLKPKVDSFEKFGFSKSDFAQVMSVNPYVLFSTAFIRAIQALKEVMKCNDYVISIMKKSHWMRYSGISNNLVPNVAILRNYGIPIELIVNNLLKRSCLLLIKPSTFEGLLIRVEKELGIPRDSSMFLYGIHLLSTQSEQNLESKFKMFESFGWRRSDVVALIRRNPFCLAFSEARIKRSLEFVMNELGYDRAFVISRCALITYSLEKRIVPRHKVLEALKEKGLIKKDYPLCSALYINEAGFLNKFVMPFEEVHEVYAKHTGISRVSSLTEGRSGGGP